MGAETGSARPPHTPGPWFVHDFADSAVSSDPSPADVTVSCDHPASITVASMGRAMTATLEEARANARLIAAAPDMLAALRVAEAVLSDYYRADPYESDRQALEVIDAAIVKALGS